MGAAPGVAVGRDDGRATALAVVLPLKVGGQWWLRFWLGVLRRSTRLRRWAFAELDGLQFIYAIRWSLLAPYQRRWGFFRPPESRWQLLFESNFDGDWDEYLENFGGVLPRGLESLLWVGEGYTGLTTPDLFKRYAKAHDHIPEHYVCGYPSLSANDIRQELVARYGRRIVAGFVAQGYAGPEPRWSTFVLPIRRGAEGDAVRAARRLDVGPGASRDEVLRATGRVHFGRVVVDQQTRHSWLLITLTHDGDVAEVLHDALDADRTLVGPSRGALHDLLGCTSGAPVGDDRRLVDHLLARRARSTVRHHLAYCAYPGFTVEQLRALDAAGRRHDVFPGWDGTP